MDSCPLLVYLRTAIRGCSGVYRADDLFLQGYCAVFWRNLDSRVVVVVASIDEEWFLSQGSGMSPGWMKCILERFAAWWLVKGLCLTPSFCFVKSIPINPLSPPLSVHLLEQSPKKQLMASFTSHSQKTNHTRQWKAAGKAIFLQQNGIIPHCF